MVSPIKIEVSIELNFSEDVKNFISSLVSNPAAPAAKPAPKPEPKPAATAPATKPAPKPEPKPAAAEAEISIDEVRKVLALKVANHRAEIKDKLEELGAPSVTKLDPAKYPVMLEFLNSLD